MAAGRRIAWSSTDRYSPVQDRAGVVDPLAGRAAAGAPAGSASTRRRTSRRWLDEREILRVDLPGRRPVPAALPRLLHRRAAGPAVDRAGLAGRRGCACRGTTSPATCTDSVPDCRTSTCSARSRRWTRRARRRKLRVGGGGRAVGHVDHQRGGLAGPLRPDLRPGAGRRRPLQGDRQPGLDRPGGERRAARQPGRVPAGRSPPSARAVADGVPVKVQITVWPRNYPTVLETVDALWEMGVRGFAFHCGSVEGVPGFPGPRAWTTWTRWPGARCVSGCTSSGTRTVTNWCTSTSRCSTSPSSELRGRVIGDEELADAYLTHVAALEEGVRVHQAVPRLPGDGRPAGVRLRQRRARPAAASVSLCNVHSPDAEAAFADYDPDSGRWAVVQDPARNQMQRMADSPHLCPAMPFATGGRSLGPGGHRGRRPLPRLPLPRLQPGGDGPRPVRPAAYEDAVAFYRAVEVLRVAVAGRPAASSHLARVRRITTGVVALRERTVGGAAGGGGARCAGLGRSCSRPGSTPDVVAAVAPAAPGRGGRATVPLGLPVFVLGADPGGAADGEAAAAPCGAAGER